MSLATATLPTDPDALRAFAARLQAELYAKTLHIEKLKAELALLKRARYGRSSERIEQLELLIGELEADEAEHEAKAPAAAPDKPRSTSSPPPWSPAPGSPRSLLAHPEPACRLGDPGAWGGCCRRICRASGSSTPPSAPARPAAAPGSAASVSTNVSCSNTCRRTSRSWSTSGRS